MGESYNKYRYTGPRYPCIPMDPAPFAAVLGPPVFSARSCAERTFRKAYLSRSWLLKSAVLLIENVPAHGKRRNTMNERPDIYCSTCGADEKALYDQVAQVIAKYKDTDGSLIMVLHAAQEIFGYLPMELQEFIADGMGLPVSEVSGVVSFYSFFSTEKRGKHTIRMCQGTACYVRGGKKVVDAIRNELDVEVGGTTEDGQFTFEIVRCIGACGLAPAMMVDDDVYKQVSPAKLRGILARYQDDLCEKEGGAGA